MPISAATSDGSVGHLPQTVSQLSINLPNEIDHRRLMSSVAASVARYDYRYILSGGLSQESGEECEYPAMEIN